MSDQDRLSQGDFRISPILFIICNLFLLAGTVVAVIDDSAQLDYLSVVTDVLVLVITALAAVMYYSRNMGANLALAITIYASAGNFIIEFIQSMYLKQAALTNQMFFLVTGLLVFLGIAGFVINRWTSVILGTITTGLIVWASFVVDDPYFLNVKLLFLIIVMGYCVVVVYYRTSLDSILKRLRLANASMKEQKEESDRLRIAAEQALAELQKAQKKIVSQEKLASLGALTAGIAHEIKNPLNFITNFSESSLELMTEVKDYIKKNSAAIVAEDREEIDYLIGELEQNMRDICAHGKRGDHIVKSMLMHSRSGNSTITREDINFLAEECLNLSFHGLRAQDSEFQSERVFKPDTGIGEVDIVRGDLGRVLINMCNNAFYSVQQKRKRNLPGYKPQVTVKTENKGDNFVIMIEDNGQGMSEETRNKLFTPFFTTKPTGEGTGLGLSMSYEIIAQEHAGEIRVESEEGHYARFILTIPKKSPVGGMS